MLEDKRIYAFFVKKGQICLISIKVISKALKLHL
uniref:Transcriptional regulator n=1 Tax=Heterorhabditis bacteriophora TaxID=37862 RepID=A0A1I7WLH9_HETBA